MILPPDVTLSECTIDPVDGAGAALLSADERARLATFAHERRRQAFVAGRVAARVLLGGRLGVPPADVPLRVAEDGAVEVEGGGLHVSISHSGRHAVAAAAPHPVGVDLEQVRPCHPGLRRFLLHPDEGGLPERLPFDADAALILCWALKEAVLKGLRTGLRLSPRRLHLTVDPAGGAAQVRLEDGSAWLARYEAREDSFLAVAYPARPQAG